MAIFHELQKKRKSASNVDLMVEINSIISEYVQVLDELIRQRLDALLTLSVSIITNDISKLSRTTTANRNGPPSKRPLWT